MNILFTGASSFSGMWFITELANSGYDVTAVFQQPLDHYAGLRRQRIEKILPLCTPVFNTSFGDENFFAAIKSKKNWNLFCHHGAAVTNYKSPTFDAPAALAKNTKNLSSVLAFLKEHGCNIVILTGSVFEQNEGAGSDNLRAVSPYGLSKGLTTDTFRFYCGLMKMKLGKFVIPNPFGPYEEGRFTTYLIHTWFQGKTAAVNTPLYIRDNIPISLLAKGYTAFSKQLNSEPGFVKFNPSCYVESQGSFTQRFANEMKQRLNIPCAFELKEQLDFNEPMIRINTDRMDWPRLLWDESQSWNDLAEYYKYAYASGAAV